MTDTTPSNAPSPHAVQDVFLCHLRRSAEAVTIFLVNGVKLQGTVSSFDRNTILLKRDGHVQLVYKSAISTIMPSTPMPRDMVEGLEEYPAAGDF
ncbi:RNA chaperone Hfq [Formicincola oecophyllae]|uniref:RNA-binding protein Hfq n=1 Tax=Formicincola oecophyllae TaxID=2558361 RepID=A0A4Y6UAQ6_9PROT|nr:RNA chaperone Hfq [Formicincola oecophyllae]QDH13658.1 RNA chaperone Hfq [Formicincola oecophyllae]